MLDLDRIRAASRYVLDLRGLLLVPFGAHGLATALLRTLDLDGWPAGGHHTPLSEGLWLGLIAATVLAYVAIRAWYWRHYGRVSRLISYRWAMLPLIAVVWGLLVRVDDGQPFHTSYLFLAALFALPLLPRYGGRSHYLLLVGGCVLLAFLPQLNLSSRDALTLNDLVLGAGLIACGLLDHQMLTRLLSGATVGESEGVTHVQGV